MATRVKDGIFVADGESSQDPEFIELNKIGYIVNCAGRQLPNLWSAHGVRYLTFTWDDDPGYVLFDTQDARRVPPAPLFFPRSRARRDARP